MKGKKGYRLPSRAVKRRRRLYSQTELAKILGVNVNTVSRLEREGLPWLVVRYMEAVGCHLECYPYRKGSEGGSEGAGASPSLRSGRSSPPAASGEPPATP